MQAFDSFQFSRFHIEGDLLILETDHCGITIGRPNIAVLPKRTILAIVDGRQLNWILLCIGLLSIIAGIILSYNQIGEIFIIAGCEILSIMTVLYLGSSLRIITKSGTYKSNCCPIDHTNMINWLRSDNGYQQLTSS